MTKIAVSPIWITSLPAFIHSEIDLFDHKPAPTENPQLDLNANPCFSSVTNVLDSPLFRERTSHLPVRAISLMNIAIVILRSLVSNFRKKCNMLAWYATIQSPETLENNVISRSIVRHSIFEILYLSKVCAPLLNQLVHKNQSTATDSYKVITLHSYSMILLKSCNLKYLPSFL